MAIFIIAEPCVAVKDAACVEVCPVDCIYEGADKYYIHPDECIECGACEPECPVDAIFDTDSVPPQWKNYIDIDRDFCRENVGRVVAPTPAVHDHQHHGALPLHRHSL